MTRASCGMAPLVGARRDGRLGAREVASLERHLAGCESCRAAAQRLARIAERARAPSGPPVSPLEHQRRRLELLRAAALPRSRRAARRPGTAPRVALAVAAALGLLLLVLVAPRRPPAAPIAARMPRVARPAPARAETTLRASPGARYERASAGGVERIALADGTLELVVRPLLPTERFVVATADAEVEVRGTVFRVEARDGHLAAVGVSEGKVEVRHLGASVLIPAGGAWSPPLDGPAAAPAPRAMARPAHPTAGPVASNRPSDAKPTASKDFADGVGLIERGDFGAAAEKLEAFRAANPGDARAEDAAYLGVLALQRAGRRPAVAAAATRYLALFPHEPRSPAVRAILDNP